MGRCTYPPVVKLNPSVAVTPKLLWFPVSKKGRKAGEVLLAAELLLKNKVGKLCRRLTLWNPNLMKTCLAKDAVLHPLGGQ